MGTIMYKGESYGGGGGTNVVANPSGTATGALNKLQVGNDIYSVGGGSGSGDSYSTTEQVVGTWIDNRPLYQKTYYDSNSWWSSNVEVLDANFLPSNIDNFFVTDMHFTVNGSYVNGSGNVGSAGMEVSCGSSGLVISCVEGVTVTELYITIRYTKVADIQE